MTGFDYAVAGIVVLSGLLGWWRGLVYEVLSLLGWVAAYVAARLFAADAAPLMPAALGAEDVRMAAAFALLFVAALIVGGILAWLLSKLVKWVGLGWLDGSLGALFGMLRGMLVTLVLVLLAGLTGLPQQPYWRDAWLSKPLVNVVLAARNQLPQNVTQRLHY